MASLGHNYFMCNDESYDSTIATFERHGSCCWPDACLIHWIDRCRSGMITLGIEQNGPTLTDGICQLFSEHRHTFTLLQISLKFVPKGPIGKKSTLLTPKKTPTPPGKTRVTEPLKTEWNDSPHKGPITRKVFNVMTSSNALGCDCCPERIKYQQQAPCWLQRSVWFLQISHYVLWFATILFLNWWNSVLTKRNWQYISLTLSIGTQVYSGLRGVNCMAGGRFP